MTWDDIKRELTEERGRQCEFCSEPAVDAHHAIVSTQKRSRKLLNVPQNLVLVCRACHVDSKDAMRQAWRLLVERYGREVMVDWLDGLDLLVKPRVEYLDDD